jgi:hypothetical protein
MKARTILGFLVASLVIGSSCYLGFQALMKGCILWSCAPPRHFTVFDPELPISLFPDDSIQNSLHPLSELSGAQEASISNTYWNEGKGLAVYNIDRFSTDHRARQRFNTLVQMSEIPLKANIARPHSVSDEFMTGCGYSEFGGDACMIIARYDEFVLSFVAYIDREMTVERFQRIATYIDEEMTQLMEKES